MHLGVGSPKIGVGFYPPNHPLNNRVFHEIKFIHFGVPLFLG